MNVELTHDAGGPRDLPTDGLPEVAFLGRSNVGKSSLINALLGRKQLARTSGTPGKTRRIHFYRVENAAYLVDLPGYGYARMAKREQRGFASMVEGYLRGEREALRGALLLVDIRRDWRPEEDQLVGWLRSQGIALRLVLTKADKLSRSEAQKRVRGLARSLELEPGHLAPVSARTRDGLGTLAGWLEEWMGLTLRRPDGRAL